MRARPCLAMSRAGHRSTGVGGWTNDHVRRVSGTDRCPVCHAAGGRLVNRRRPSLLLLSLMMAVGPFGDTEYAPALPAIAHALHADYGMVQLTMSSYLFGSALSRLAYGPLSDRFGRRPVMSWGALVLLAGALACLASFAIWPLIAARLVQGMGGCAGGVIADAVVRDAFPADRRQGIYAHINAVFALAPAIGPVAGIYLTQWLGWHANFALLVLLSALLWLAVWCYLPETNAEPDGHALEPARLWHNARDALATRGFLLHAALGGFAVGVVYTALIGAPDLVLNVFGKGNLAIMLVSLAILVAFVTGAGAGALAGRKLSPDGLIAAGLLVLLAGSSWLLALALLVGKHGSLWQFLAPIAICFVGVGLLVPSATARAMAPFGDNTGMASSLLGSIQMAVAALGTLGMGLMHAGSVVDIPVVFMVLTGMACATFVWARAAHGWNAHQAT